MAHHRPIARGIVPLGIQIQVHVHLQNSESSQPSIGDLELQGNFNKDSVVLPTSLATYAHEVPWQGGLSNFTFTSETPSSHLFCNSLSSFRYSGSTWGDSFPS